MYCMPYPLLSPFLSVLTDFFQLKPAAHPKSGPFCIMSSSNLDNFRALLYCTTPPSLFLISITRKSPHQSPLQKRKHKSRTLHSGCTQSLNRQGYMILLVTRLEHRGERTLLTHLKTLSLSCSAICLS